MTKLDQNYCLTKLREFQQGSHRRFSSSFSPEYSDILWIGRQTFHRVINKVNTVNWFEVGPMQSPVDLMTYMECLMKTKPRVLIETGTCGGGGTIFYADVLRRIHGHGNFRIITIELNNDMIGDVGRNKLKSIPEIISIMGSSIDPRVLSEVYRLVHEFGGPVMVTLDSDHSAEHVLKELVAYSDIVDIGQYLIVQDTYLGLYWGGNVEINSPDAPFDYKGSPLAAVEVFLSCDRENNNGNDRFEIDLYPQRWILVQSPFGFLYRRR